MSAVIWFIDQFDNMIYFYLLIFTFLLVCFGDEVAESGGV